MGMASKESIRIKNIRQNNLKGVDLSVPLGSFTVICGPSGSGKSSLAFETLYAEGQRRFIESLNSYARQFLNKASKPLVDSVENIPPAIALEQKNTVRNSRSTVGTTSDVLDFLRLLFSKIGHVHCPNGHGRIHKSPPLKVVEDLCEKWDGKRAFLLAPVIKEEQILPNAKLVRLLIADGYSRIFVPNNKKRIKSASEAGKFIDLSLKTKASEIPKKNFFVVIDRFAVDNDEQGRLLDSITQAYQASLHYNKSLNGGQLHVMNTDGEKLRYTENFLCNECDHHVHEVSPQTFSYNSPLGACVTCNGFGNILDLDEEKIVPNPKLSISEGALYPYTMPSAATQKRNLFKYCRENDISLDDSWEDLPKKSRNAIWKGHKRFKGVLGMFKHLETKKYKMYVRVFLARFKSSFPCTTCDGSRLKPEVDHITINDKNISNIAAMTLLELHEWSKNISISEQEMTSIKEVYQQLLSRLKFLVDIGVHYLTLSRLTKTLSGGEFQRLMLAKQLGMGLADTLYVLDEPTIGLHPRDNDRLIEQLKLLNEQGNTLVVVEHDESVIKNSNHVIEMGPGSGNLGGEIVYEGQRDKFLSSPESLTASYLNHSRVQQQLISPRDVDLSKYKYVLTLSGCSGNNLKNVNLKLPLNRVVTVTGVSGSGKSTLVTQTLYPALTQVLNTDYQRGLPYKNIKGFEHLKNVLYINQEAVGRTARSNPLTYLKVYDAIREIFSQSDVSRERGYTPGIFSLNVNGGRCPVCKGLGYEEVDMVFMDNIRSKCPSCKGARFREEVLDAKYKGKSILEVLQLTVKESLDFFIHYPNIRRPLAFLKEVGLEYLQIGQSTSTFSGGEIQRIKIAKELLNSKHKETLYILDEPTTGLHFREVQLLMDVLDKIVEAGGSVLLIEHNLDVMMRSDYIIDIGPEAGAMGGKVEAYGSPLQMVKKKTHTGKALKEHLEWKGFLK